MLRLATFALLFVLPLCAQEPSKAVLWTQPADISSRNLVYGMGGEKSLPSRAMTFVKEDRNGTSPKFDVKDASGRKWKAKLGAEARSETAATRLLWAVGYNADADYYVPDLEVAGLPHLHRGAKFQSADHVRGVRLKLRAKGEDNEGPWHWRKNPFTGTREFNGLRVMMCLMDNWDLKDENNRIARDENTGDSLYLVSDLGATFGKSGRSWTSDMSKDRPDDYRRARFVTKKTDRYVDFEIAKHPPLLYTLNIVKPWRYWQFFRLRWIGKHIPRDDARWLGSLLKQLSDDQLRAAFHASGYNDQETQSLTQSVRSRIQVLSEL